MPGIRPTTKNKPLPYTTDLSSFFVKDSCLCQLVPLFEVNIVPPSPTVINKLFPYSISLNVFRFFILIYLQFNPSSEIKTLL